MSAGTATNRHLFIAGAFLAAWLLIAVASVHALMASRQLAGQGASSFDWPLLAAELLRLSPWVAAAPGLFWLARRFPISEQDTARAIVVHAVAAVVLIPLVSLSGILLARMVEVQNGFSSLKPDRILWATIMMSLYGIPMYISVAATAQANAYFERYRVRERLLAQAQLRALQAQINPHFLFNTLNAIAALGHRDAARAETALARLSELIRTALADRGQTVPLKDEIAFARGYIDLYEVLLPEKIHATFDVDDEAWNAAVPPMLLQPLIENAIVHGIAKRISGGRIALTARERNGRLTIDLSNDAADEPSTPGSAVGLANIRERMRALYGDAQACELTAAARRTTVSLVLPFTRTGAARE